MSVRLRKAEMRDQAAVNDLETLLVGFAADRRAIFDVVMASADHDLIVAEVDGAVVGLAHLLTYHDLSHGAPAGELLGLVVREAYRSHGIGRVLLEEVCRLARERHVGELHVNTELDNTRAQQLYRSIGAEVVGVQLEVNLQ